jgi:hypothetical protein
MLSDQLKKNLAWYQAHQDDVPEKLHRMKVFDTAGRPQWTPQFMRYIFDGTDSLEKSYDRVPCDHAGQPDPNRCDRCGIAGSDGGILASSGFVRREQVRYRRPMRRALKNLSRGENGQSLVGLIGIWHQEGEAGLRSMAVAMGATWETLEDQLTKALIRLKRYYRVEPEYGGLRRAPDRKLRHTSR